MPASVTIFVCTTTTDRDNATSFLQARGYTDIRVEQATQITYNRDDFFTPPAGPPDISTGHVVIGVK
jgi:hypothetical protein